MGMGEFNSDDHYIYYCGQEFHGRNVGALIINKRVWNAALGCNLKNGQNELSSFPRQVIQHHSNSSLYPYYRCWRSWSWSVLLRPRRPSRTNTKKKKKKVIFIIGDWNAKVGSQEIPGVIGKIGLGEQNEAWQRLTEFSKENALVLANILFQ